jgi:hypothetical protein
MFIRYEAYHEWLTTEMAFLKSIKGWSMENKE